MSLRRKSLSLVLTALLALAAGCGAPAPVSALPPSPEAPAPAQSGSVVESAVPSAPAPTPDPTPAPTATPVPPDSTLFPDPALFLGRQPDTDQPRRDGVYLEFNDLPLEQGQTAFAEFSELLQTDRYQLELAHTFVDDHSDATYSDSFDFNYTGTNPDVTQVSNSSKTRWYNVHLFLVCYTKTGKASLCIHYSSAFTPEDPGVYTTADIPGATPGGSGEIGSSGGSREPNVAEFARQNCLTCGGSGDCTRCGGDGYTYNDDIRSSCSRCHGSGDCSACGGTGKR